MATGTVKRFSDAKGYGFITPDGGSSNDPFVHHSVIASEGFEPLADGAKVDYELGEGAKGADCPERVSRLTSATANGGRRRGGRRSILDPEGAT